MERNHRSRQNIFSLAGWLFADLLLALTIVFLAISTPWVVASPKQSTPPAICGMEQTPQVITLSVPDPRGLRAHSSGAINGFATSLRHSALQRNANRIAGFVEVFGGSPNVGDGINFAAGAIQSLHVLARSHYVFTNQTAYFKPLWDGTLASNQVSIDVFYFKLSAVCSANG